MNRAFSVLTVKSFDEGARTFEGIATTPSTDRMGDVVESAGAKFKLPLALLLHHDATKPVGTVDSAAVAPRGITVHAHIARVDEPGALKERTDEAWHSIKSGVIRGLSIGFRVLNDAVERMENGGLRFKQLEILELSLVAVPANSEATITSVKHYAGLRRSRGAVPLLAGSGGLGSARKGVRLLNASRSRW